MSLTVNGICRLTRDAEIKNTGQYGAFITMGIATHRKNAKEGKQGVDFFDLEYFCRAEVDANAFIGPLKKGVRIYINSAILQRDEYVDPNSGEKKYKFRINVFSFDLLDAPAEGVTRPAAPAAAAPRAATAPVAKTVAKPAPAQPAPAAKKVSPPPDPVVEQYAEEHTVEPFEEVINGPDQEVPWEE